jgi:hypothetical protein
MPDHAGLAWQSLAHAKRVAIIDRVVVEVIGSAFKAVC